MNPLNATPLRPGSTFIDGFSKLIPQRIAVEINKCRVGTEWRSVWWIRQSAPKWLLLLGEVTNVYDPITTKSLLTFADSNTRAHKYKLTKPRFNSKQFQYFFSNRVVNIWNGLPQEVVTAQSTNMFKNKIDKLLKNHMYSTNLELYYWSGPNHYWVKAETSTYAIHI